MKQPQNARLAYLNERFVRSVPARPLRILAEYIDPLTRFQTEGIADTIVMFGSARILPRGRAVAQLARTRRSVGRRRDPASRERMRQARDAVAMSRYYEEARRLSARITAWSLTLGESPRRFVICSGGGPGIMEAANRGAIDAGGKTLGLGIELPHEQRLNQFISPGLGFNFHYFFMRKLWFAQIAKALIVFPGGFGTMDELWEMLTLLQTGKLGRHHVILIYGRRYWDRVLNWRHMIRSGTITEREYSVLEFADTVDEAFERVKAALVKFHLQLGANWPL
jgi:uncharacterized protein (TIGR00730 family)